jgi:hypothetical protein
VYLSYLTCYRRTARLEIHIETFATVVLGCQHRLVDTNDVVSFFVSRYIIRFDITYIALLVFAGHDTESLMESTDFVHWNGRHC